ncbi:NAD(P)-dependent glycerol-1-phosphate dehydrogenase [[Eubacterium] cellulosolvens]
MDIHRMQLPREVLVGKDVIKQTGEMCRILGLSGNAFAVTGPKTHKIVSNDLEDSLKKENIDIEYYIVHKANLESVNQVEEAIKRKQPTVILGAGGGKDIDVAKLCSAKVGIPFISIPTAASHDGIASAHSSIRGSHQPFSVKGQAPIAIIADINLIAQSPYRLTASGCGDVIAKYTAVHDWRLAKKMANEYYGDYAANLALMSATLVMKSAVKVRRKQEDAIRTVVEALISCGVAMSIAGSSRPCSGSEHLFSHALDLISPNKALHGEKCAVGTILCAYLQGRDWNAVKTVLTKIGTPTTANELGVKQEEIIQALTTARDVRPERYTILSLKKVDRNIAEKTAKTTGVID